MTVVSTLVLSQFMNCPYVGAITPGPLPTKINPPVNTALPTITGSPLTVGTVLTATTGSWISSTDITYTYQWNRSGTPILGATSKTYIIDGADVGSTLTVTVTAHNPGGHTDATSAATNVVGGLLNQHLPIISGTLVVGNTLTTDNGGWVGAPPPTFAYSWQRDGVDVPGATTNTYVLTSADTGHLITSRVIATNIAGSVSAYSASMGPITEHLVNTVPPVVTGDPTVGTVLSVTSGTWTGTTPITITYQWTSNGVAVSGATTTSYILVTSDLGNTIACVVTGSNSLDTINVTSNSVGPIIPPATVALSKSVVAKSATVGTVIGALSVTGGTGTYTYTLTSNPSGQFAISGSNLTVATTLNSGSYSVTVKATGGVPSTATSTFTITVAAIVLSASTIPQDANVGDTIGTFSVSGGTGTYTYTLTSNPGSLFAISGANLTVATGLSPGSYPISVQAIGGVPTPISESFMITVTTVVVTHTEGAWFGGLPYPGIAIVANKAGTGTYWFSGLVDPILKD
jgi:hypothetical protein